MMTLIIMLPTQGPKCCLKNRTIERRKNLTFWIRSITFRQPMIIYDDTRWTFLYQHITLFREIQVQVNPTFVNDKLTFLVFHACWAKSRTFIYCAPVWQMTPPH